MLLAALAVPLTPPASAKPRLCANTYGGDFVQARGGLRCAKARAVVRAWAAGYKSDGHTDRVALRFACSGRNDSVEGLVVNCHKGGRSVSFYANVPL